MKKSNAARDLCIAIFFVLVGPATGFSGEQQRGKPYVPAHPADDRDDLADLAPPANDTTSAGTYGDAAFARRSRAASRGFGVDRRARTVCPAQTAHATIAGCLNETSGFFARNYVYTPSYVSAPQVFLQTPRRPSPILSPVTAFFFYPFP